MTTKLTTRQAFVDRALARDRRALYNTLRSYPGHPPDRGGVFAKVLL